jgi:hypothetical protein
MDVDELIARESIRDLVARYNSNGDSGRFEDLLALFAPHAVMAVDGEVHDGHEAIRAMFEAAAATVVAHGSGTRYIRHFTGTHQIDVLSGTEAKGRCYYQVVTPEGLDHWGRYLDEYAVVEGRWLFTRRREILDGLVAGGWAASATGA